MDDGSVRRAHYCSLRPFSSRVKFDFTKERPVEGAAATAARCATKAKPVGWVEPKAKPNTFATRTPWPESAPWAAMASALCSAVWASRGGAGCCRRGQLRGKTPIVLAVPPGSLCVAGKQRLVNCAPPYLQRREARHTSHSIPNRQDSPKLAILLPQRTRRAQRAFNRTPILRVLCVLRGKNEAAYWTPATGSPSSNRGSTKAIHHFRGRNRPIKRRHSSICRA
jgi:hypothetical protein